MTPNAKSIDLADEFNTTYALSKLCMTKEHMNRTIFICSIICHFITTSLSGQVKNWERKYFEKPLFEPFIFLVVYGDFNADFQLQEGIYQTAGIPEGIELMAYDVASHPEVPNSFLTGYLWEEVKKSQPAFADRIEKAKECYTFRGTVADTSNLNYLRDVVGLTAYLLDHGGIGVYDAQMFTFWNKNDWTNRIYKPDGAVPRNHVMIFHSEEKNGTQWYHTRGMRKFGRPDVSIHKVKPEYESAVIDMINRFIEFQAFGGIINDEQKIKMTALPDGMRCKNQGSFDDPEFNNKHLEIYWK